MHFLSGRLLGNPDVARAFAHPQVPGLYREGKRILFFIEIKFRPLLPGLTVVHPVEDSPPSPTRV